MRKVILLALMLISMTFFSYAQQSLTVAITQPQPDAKVEQRATVSGSVSDPRAKVWVVIHPTETSGFWVQPPVTVDSDGTWSVLAYFGEGSRDSGKPYEIRAFANPSETLKPGERSDWPTASAQSKVVRVTRK